MRRSDPLSPRSGRGQALRQLPLEGERGSGAFEGRCEGDLGVG